MTSKMKDYKYCNQLFDMALDNGIVTEQDRGRFMESDTKALIDSEWIEIICDLDNSGFAGYVLKTMAFEYDIFCVDPSYKRKTSTKPTTDRIKEAFDAFSNKRRYTYEEFEFASQFKKTVLMVNARIFYAGYMAALKDRGEK